MVPDQQGLPGQNNEIVVIFDLPENVFIESEHVGVEGPVWQVWGSYCLGERFVECGILNQRFTSRKRREIMNLNLG